LLGKALDEHKPIFLQVKEWIEDQIINDEIQEEDQIPSTTQIVQFYKINHVTVSKGINLLLDANIVYKKRGVGMFVAKGAKEKLIRIRKDAFLNQYVLPLVQEAEKLGISGAEIEGFIKKVKEQKNHEI